MAGSRPSKNSHTLGRLFNDSLDWFDYVEFGEELRTDFQQKFLQLGCKRLRVSRWGQAVGLSGELKHLETEAVPTNELLQAEDTLRSISEVFSRFSGAFYARATTQPQVLNYKEAMDPIGRSLHDSIEAVATQRKNNSQCMPKNRWAFFNENEFEQFMTALSPLIEKLVNTVPAALEVQQNLCEDEISQLGANENLRMLLGIVATQDKYLKKAISKALGLSKPGSNMNDQNNSYHHCKLNVAIYNMNDNNIAAFHASF